MKSFTDYLRALGAPADLSICLLDVGARWGLNPPWDKLPDETLQYIGFEPDRVEFETLSENLPKGVTYFNTALLDEYKQVELFITKEPGCSSVFLPNEKVLSKFFFSERWEVVSKQRISVKPLDNVLEEQKVRPDAAKIDVQGAAYEVLIGGQDALTNLLFIEVETEFQELYRGQKLFDDVFKLLIKNDFMLLDMNKHWARRSILPREYSSRGQVVFADCLFVRRPDKLWNSQSIKDPTIIRNIVYRYIVMASLYGHFDLALEVIEQSDSPLTMDERDKARYAIEEFIRFGLIVRISSRIPFLGRIGWVASHLIAKIQGFDRLYGWGSDFNTVEKRYRHLGHTKLSSLFRK